MDPRVWSIRALEPHYQKAFLALGPEEAAAVIAQDKLNVGDEVDALKFALKWARQDPARAEQAGSLFRQVRLELLSFKQLMEWQGRLAAEDAQVAGVRAQLSGAVRETFQRKLDSSAGNGVPEPPRKRKRVALADEEEEENTRKMLRAALELFGAAPAPAAPSAGLAK